MEKIDVSALDIKNYAISNGWALVKEALKDGLFVLNSPFGDYSQLVFPKDSTTLEFQEMANVCINRLSELYRLSKRNIIEAIREVNDDVVCLRYFSDTKSINSISFDEAIDAIEATKKMLLSAASSVVNPTMYHLKLNRTEPQELIKKTRFRHTEEGSFVLKISCPFEMVHSSPNIFEDTAELPFSRKALMNVNQSSFDILNAIDEDTIGELYNNQFNASLPSISYNFCDSLIKLFDEERELPFELIFNWSRASKLKIPLPNLPHKIRFPFSHKSKIEEVKEYFAPKNQDLSGEFIGTVETLNGEISKDGRRQGEVFVSILYEDQILKTKLMLDADQYVTALEAHKAAGKYVKLYGALKRQKGFYNMVLGSFGVV